MDNRKAECNHLHTGFKSNGRESDTNATTAKTKRTEQKQRKKKKKSNAKETLRK